MRALPDVLGMELEEAVARLQEAGWEVEVRSTFPCRGKPRGPRRVVRCRRTAATRVEVVAAHQGWEEVGATNSG
ncbi:MAG: PASTA domain-containing protein [Desulfotomaculales bacterium]